MSLKELARDDLNNRFASHTFTETVVGDMTLVEFKNAGSVVVGEAIKLDVDDAYLAIRLDLVGQLDILFRLTTTEKNALTGTVSGQVLFDITLNRSETWDGSAWVGGGGDLGYTLVWGANMQTTGRYAQVNGITSGGEETGLSPGSEYIVPADGTLDCLTYNTGTGDNTTVFKIWKNGIVEHTFTATGSGDFESGIGLSVVAGDLVAVEYDAGMRPAGSVYVAYIV